MTEPTTDRPRLLLVGNPAPAMMDKLTEAFEVLRLPKDDPDAFLAANGAGIQYAQLVGHTVIGAEMLDRLPDLRVLSNLGVGYDVIDAVAATERGIVVTHTPDVLNDEVANTAILLMLGVARNFAQDERYARSGRWETEGMAPLSRSVRGLTAGIVGMGRIGQAIAGKLAVFGTETVYHARSPKDVPYRYFGDLTEMAQASDILIVITPGGPETEHLVNRAVIDALGPRGILINVARGSVVDEAALIAALQEGRLGAAGLDVFENEPRIPQALREMENVTLLPHVGSATVETRQAMADLAVRNLTEFKVSGRAVTPVPECQHL